MVRESRVAVFCASIRPTIVLLILDWYCLSDSSLVCSRVRAAFPLQMIIEVYAYPMRMFETMCVHAYILYT